MKQILNKKLCLKLVSPVKHLINYVQTFNEWVRRVSGLGIGSGPKTQTQTQNIKKISDPDPDPNTPKKLGPDPNSDPNTQKNWVQTQAQTQVFYEFWKKF